MRCSTADAVHSGALTTINLYADTLIHPTRTLFELALPLLTVQLPTVLLP
jgi:hypothetical protein